MKDKNNNNLHKIQKPENDDVLAKRSIVDQTKMSEHNYRKCFGNCSYFIVEINLFRDAHDDPTRWWRLLTSTFPYALRSLCCVGYTFVRSHVKYHSSTGTEYTCFIARVWVTTHLVTLQVCLISSIMAHCLHYITSKIDVFQPIPMKRGIASFFLLISWSIRYQIWKRVRLIITFFKWQADHIFASKWVFVCTFTVLRGMIKRNMWFK